ncbi:MAG: hypothetical protein KBF57_02945 [Saprospiraceae bacterium]|jgi:hypothetical protein|nr:hypothetical protein [Saprospiraceae bacterium]MBP9193610.1 hypothetical protein [Saprospiraceae bacterium]
MKVTKETHLLSLQLAFNEKFPHLKISFYKGKHDKNELSPIAEELFRDFTVGELNPDFTEAEFIFYEHETVSDFEEKMEKNFGLHVQVLRKSGQTWIQTSVTDEWTLKKQEEHGH